MVWFSLAPYTIYLFLVISNEYPFLFAIWAVFCRYFHFLVLRIKFYFSIYIKKIKYSIYVLFFRLTILFHSHYTQHIHKLCIWTVLSYHDINTVYFHLSLYLSENKILNIENSFSISIFCLQSYMQNVLWTFSDWAHHMPNRYLSNSLQ